MSESRKTVGPRRAGPATPALAPTLALSVGLALALAGPGRAAADTFYLTHPGDSVIGSAFYVKSRKKDTLLDFARQNGQGYDDMLHANPKVDMWVPGKGRDVMIPTFWVLPDTPHNGIVLNRAEKRLYYYPPGEPNKVETFAISIGREGWNTPLGSFSIAKKIKDPTWTPPASVKAEHAAEGDILPDVVPAGPDNPLGLYAMKLSIPGYLIHGTNKPWGLGMQVSHGCIRMYPEGVQELFGQVSEGTTVTIVDQPYKVGWLGDDLYLEVHREPDAQRVSARQAIPESVASTPGLKMDWRAAERAVNENAGFPELVGSRRSSADGPHLDMIF
jgi:L,D-transpeptidase ErfK/SrfK